MNNHSQQKCSLFFLSGAKIEGKGACQLRAQVLRAAASRVPPLALRLPLKAVQGYLYVD